MAEIADRLQGLETKLAGATTRVENAASELHSLEAEHEESRRTLAEHQAEEHSAQLEAERHKRLVDWHAGRLEDFMQEQRAAGSQRPELETEITGFEAAALGTTESLAQLTAELHQESLDDAQELATYWTMRSAVAQQAADAARLRLHEHELAVEKLSRQVVDQEAASRAKRAPLFSNSKMTGRCWWPAKVAYKRSPTSSRNTLARPSRSWRASSVRGGLEEAETTASGARRARIACWLSSRSTLCDARRDWNHCEGGSWTTSGWFPLSMLPTWRALFRCRSKVWSSNCTTVPELAPDLEDQLNQRRARVRRLGLINPEAARDYEAESNRYSFLTAQVQDLRQAEADLQAGHCRAG